jgi:hypothetical protein
MLDLSYFAVPTFLGANLAQFSFSAGMLTMLTFVPILLQNGFGHASASAGLMILPMVVPLFIVPRLVSRHLAHRLSGRALLALGLCLVCIGLFWCAAVVRNLAYVPMIGGMLITGIGAGLLNGETTKVGMTVIPKERSGMASGVSGTMRFTGLVVGIAGLGVVLYSRIAAVISDALPGVAPADRQALIRAVTAGHVSDATLPGHGHAAVQALALASFADGYQWLFLAGGTFMAVSTLLTWRLVSADETRPVSAPVRRTAPHAVR